MTFTVTLGVLDGWTGADVATIRFPNYYVPALGNVACSASVVTTAAAEAVGEVEAILEVR